MRRLLWIGVGAVGAVVAAERVRRTARRYTPAAVSEQVEAAGRRTTSALHQAVDTFRTARETREKDLLTSLLVTPEEGDAGAVFSRAGARTTATDGSDAERPPAATADVRARPAGRVDENDSLYDF